MMVNVFFIFLLLTGLQLGRVSAVAGSEAPPPPFDIDIANSSVWYSAAASCGKDAYSTRVWKGPSEGFVYRGLIYDKSSDTQGYYGVQENSKQIWIVYRGTISKLNWLDDAEVRLVDAEYLDCPSCRVHRGFKKCKDRTIDQVKSAVDTLTNEFPGFEIMVTGHSLGGALANLASIDLLRAGVNVTHYSFGSPRVGNKEYSDYANSLMKGTAQRITHFKDPVPHTPFESMGYVHILTEVYEDELHALHGCSGVDDASCAEQWEFKETNGDDHVLYLNLGMYCENVSILNAAIREPRNLHPV